MSVSGLRSGRLVRGPGRKAVENRGERSLKRGPTDLDVLTSGRTGSRGRSSSGEGHCPVNIQCLAPLHHAKHLGIVPRTPMAEPEATPAELDEIVMDTDDQDAVSEAFERGCAQMRATLNRTKARVLSATGGAVEMKARTEDTSCYWQTFVRLCSGNSEQVRNELTLWRINKNDIETGELGSPGSNGQMSERGCKSASLQQSRQADG